MKRPTPRLTSNKAETIGELPCLLLLLRHVNDRLRLLTPGINCTFKQYSKFMDERIDLTLLINKVILNSRGETFFEEADTIYTINNVALKLGGIYKQRVRS